MHRRYSLAAQVLGFAVLAVGANLFAISPIKPSQINLLLQQANPPAASDAAFDRWSETYLREHFDARPLRGVELGWHRYDGKFVVPSRTAIAAEVQRLKRRATELRAMSETLLSPDRRKDRSLLLATIGGELWSLESVREPWRNPMFYASALDVSVYLKRNFKPLAARVQDITAILQQSGPLFEAARANLDRVLPQEFIATATDIAEGTASFLERDVAKEVQTTSDAEVVAAFTRNMQQAVKEIRGYIDWLKRERLPRANHGYAIGRERYIEMLAAELITITPERLLEIGLTELKAEQARFAAAARVIDPGKPPIEVFKAIQKDHPTAATLLPDTRKNLEAIRAFVVEHKLVTIPSEVRAQVAETLPPFRATSFASMDTPGPFEKVATEAYYYVTPVEPEWPEAQKEEWLSAFNYYTTDVVSIHEAYPGHYVQFLSLNASRASDVAKVFVSYAFTEGWAHYTEEFVLDAGFMQPAKGAAASREQQIRAAKYRLAQSDEALLRACRLCCSIKLHTQGMSVDEATRFFVDNCYYEEKPARTEATRGTYDPGYLYYTLGKLQIRKLRRDWQAQEGAAFTLQRFHDAVLSHGMPPIRLLREQMLRDPKQWPEIL
jgi:uncharacterized protein (DUF885 family)